MTVFPIRDRGRRLCPPTGPQHILLTNPVWSINSKKSTVWRRSGGRGPREISQSPASLVNRTRRTIHIHELTLRRPGRHLPIPLVISHLGAKSPRVSRESRHLPLILTLSRPGLQQMSTSQHTPQPFLPPGVLHPLHPTILALGPLRLLCQRTLLLYECRYRYPL